MNRKLVSIVLAGLMASSCTVTGFAGETEASTEAGLDDYSGVKVACIVKTEDNVYWSDMGAAIEDWAKENNATVDMYYAESEENIEGQLAQFENFIGMGYDAICFAPLTSQNLIEGVKKATDAGIVCVNIDESMDFDACREAGGVVYSNFVTDNELVGKKAAEYLGEKLGGSGEVAIVEGAAGNTTSQARTKGATDEFKNQGLTLVSSEPGDWDRMKSMDVATAMMTANPDLKAIYACNDVEALGVTEAGTERMGLIKSAVGIGSLLHDGIGETIRVSLTDDPIREIAAAKDILKSIGKRGGVQIVSCPTCGRTKIDLVSLAKQVEEAVKDVEKDVKIAVMGCVVNGPGEAREADIGVAGGDGFGVLFKSGEILRKVPENEIVPALLEELSKL